MRSLVLILISILLFSCNKLEEGKVIEKYWVKGHYYTTMMLAGKVLIPQTHYAQPSYHIVLRGVYKGDTLTEDHSIGLDAWNGCDVGTYVKFEE